MSESVLLDTCDCLVIVCTCTCVHNIRTYVDTLICIYVIVCRSSVVGNFKNEDIFLEHEGMFLLLDLLEV